MRAIAAQTAHKMMLFAVRPLEERDIAQSKEIERDAFPTQFPPTSFRRELKHRLARYLVTWRFIAADQSNGHTTTSPSRPQENGNSSLIRRLLNNAKTIWTAVDPARGRDGIILSGYVGTWYMIDEAHIISVGVRNEYRGLGVGELLLISTIEQAMMRRARVVTLEVRSSNDIARRLYLKYGFEERGVRKAYYTDNGEDAIIMTTDPINTPSYTGTFRRLVEAHERRWGLSHRRVS